jgi:hypothetical protein
LETVPTSTAGTSRIVVGGANAAIGNYSVEVTLNAAVETEGVTTGSNATPATAQDINGSFIGLKTPLTRAQRGAALGTTENSLVYAASSIASSFIDISPTGNRSVSAVGRDGTDTLNASQLGGFTFKFFGTTYGSLSFSTNGLISFGVADPEDFNTDLSTSPLEPVIAPFWAQIAIANDSAGNSGIFWQTIGSGANQQLIIQWNNADLIGFDPAATFEAILSTDGTIQFNYGPFIEASDFDGVTVGVKAAGTTNPVRTLLDFNGAESSGNLLGPGQSVRLTPPNPSFDFYSLAVAAGQTSTLALTGLTPGNLHLDLLAPDGTTVLASGIGGGPNQAVAIRSFTFAMAGTYYARVSGDDVTRYCLVATRDAAFGAGTHFSFATAQDIGSAHTLLGGFATSAAAGTITVDAFNSGSWDNFGDHFAGIESFEVGQEFPGLVFNDYFVFDLSGINQEITSAQLTLSVSDPFGFYSSPDPSETINFSDVSTPITQLEGAGLGLTEVFNDLGTGTSFGAQTVTPSDTSVTTSLNADGLNALTAGLASQFAIGGSLTSLEGFDPQILFGDSGNPGDERRLTLTVNQTADWYKLTLPSDRTAVQLDTSTPFDGNGQVVNTLDPHLELYDANDHLIASGTALADGRNETMRATSLTPGATYYIRVTTEHNTTGEYVLGVTPLRTPTVTSTVDDAPKGAEEQPDGEFHVPNSLDKNWTHIVSPAGFQGDYTIHAQNASPQKSNFAQWEIRATSANPELFATWVALPGNATNATYQVFADSGNGGNDDTPLLSVVVDQTRVPGDALLFGTTLAQSLGSVNLPRWKPGTMLSVRLLTQGANGNVVADGIFDPPVGAVNRSDPVPQAPHVLAARDPMAIAPSLLAVPISMAPDNTGTARREAAVDLLFRAALSGGFEATVPLALGDSPFAQPAPELSPPGRFVTDCPVVGPTPPGAPEASLDWADIALGFQTRTTVDTSNSTILGTAIVDILARGGGCGGGGG